MHLLLLQLTLSFVGSVAFDNVNSKILQNIGVSLHSLLWTFNNYVFYFSGGQFIIVNGPALTFGGQSQVWGFVMDFKTQKIVSKFGPKGAQFHNPHDVAVTPDGKEIYVAELAPMRIHKFEATHSLNRMSDETYVSASVTTTDNHSMPSAKAILVVTLMLLFAMSTFLLALYMARHRQRGCLLLTEPKPRHAWDLPTKTEVFKLGNLISQRRSDRRDRRGFEQLLQNGSDDEREQVTTTLSDTNSAKNNFTNVQYT